MRFSVLAAFAALLALPVAAHAQGTPMAAPQGAQQVTPNFDQYPSFIQVSTALQNGSEMMLRCGYTQTGSTFAADPGYMEMSSSGGNSYMRYQRIDNQIIITVPAQGVPGRYLLEIVQANGAMAAKNCQTDLGSDTLQSCTTAQPFMPAAQATMEDQNAASQCGSFLAKATPTLNQSTYSTPKTDQFKNTLRQKARLLLAP